MGYYDEFLNYWNQRVSTKGGGQPLYTIGLSDADPSSALLFMKQKLSNAGIDVDFTSRQTEYVQRLGGRTSDLESVGENVSNLLHESNAIIS